MTDKKTCTKCLRLYDNTLDNFHSDGRGGLRKQCKMCCSAQKRGYQIEVTEVEPQVKLKRTKSYIVTYAQNATPVNLMFWKSIQQFVKHNDAQIVVIAGRYKNPTSVWTQDMTEEDWWDGHVTPYVFAGIHNVNSNLGIFANISIQPTAIRPLSGFEVFVKNQSAIFGHPKVELKTIATDKRSWPRILTSTGAVTEPNYTDSKAGKKAEGHHTFGACIVETCGKKFYLRHVTARSDGSFQDLDKLYSPSEVVGDQTIEALICGDIHVSNQDTLVTKATFTNKDSVVAVLKPKNIIYHDVLDMKARSKHDYSDMRNRYVRHFGVEINSVKTELENTVTYLVNHTPADTNAFVVASNHDDHLMHWLNSANIKDDPENALIFHKLWCWMLEYFHEHKEFSSPLALFFMNQYPLYDSKIKFLKENEKLSIADHACSFHGHNGVNGSRGNIGSYSKLGTKTVIGHSHTPGIQDHCMQVGVTGSLDHNYNKLPSSWFHAHGILYKDGTRTLLHIVDGKWKIKGSCGNNISSNTQKHK